MRIRYYLRWFLGAAGKKKPNVLNRPVMLGEGVIFYVPSSKPANPPYVVGVMTGGEAVCSCPAYTFDKQERDSCKHIEALTVFKKFPKKRGVLA